jgi:hypothetical protein
MQDSVLFTRQLGAFDDAAAATAPAETPSLAEAKKVASKEE